VWAPRLSAASATEALRLGVPSDVGSVVAFLLSGDACWLTGQTLAIDGGLTLPAAGEPTGLAPNYFLDTIGDLT
jgi:NAD(P)-dependent dehydrogenase (short-subunit alcohol dehydrogenase family)